MAVKTVRKIVRIDEEKCNGCGVCVPACVEGALKIIDGKARLISETYCDGLGACLGECPQGAITVEEREAAGFDERAVKQHPETDAPEEGLACGCPGARVAEFKEPDAVPAETEPYMVSPSTLKHWPVQLTLVPTRAPFLQGADVLFTAHCVPFAYGGFHRDFLKNHALLIACPKLDDFDAHLEKLTRILVDSNIKSLTVVHMEVPCCAGLVFMAKKAIEASGKKIPLKEVTIGIRGDVKND